MRVNGHIGVGLLAGLAVIALAGDASGQAESPYDPERMDAAREAMRAHHGSATAWFLQGERVEHQTNDGDGLFLWDAQGWYGGDINKAWIKTEGEYSYSENALEEAEFQLLYSRAIGAFFDAQIGVRQDFESGPSRTFAVIGLQGLAPYFLELDSAIFISGRGDVTARIEVEYELLLTQRLIAQPRAELNFALQDVDSAGLGSGLSTAELGLRLRYEVRRELAPYIGFSWTRSVGDTADFARADSREPGAKSFIAGLRFWF